jgi:MarR family transcriptional regulator for hemolysin
MQPLKERFSAALHYSARAWRLGLDRRLKHLGLGQAGWMSVGILAKAGELLSQSELADRVGVEGATMVTMIDRLVNNGLVERQPCTKDRRVKRIALTKSGWALYETVKAEADAFRREMLKNVDDDLLLKATELLEQLREAAEATK